MQPTPIELAPIANTDVAPVDATLSRPLLSVVIPVYEPKRLLLKALATVLRQDLGAAKMQIAVVDDASPTCDVAALIAEAAPRGRIELYRATRNQGLAGNWNQCIRVARGQVVHLLHQDDWIENGFYSRMLPAFAVRERVGMAFCRHAITEGDESIVRYTHLERWRAGILPNWVEKISERQRIQCAAVLVRRSVYEQLGGYRPDLCYALDWEMWVRIACHFQVWYEPQRLAFYRRHDASESKRLSVGNAAELDELKAIGIFAEYLPDDAKERMRTAAYVRFIGRTLKQLQRAGVNSSVQARERLQLVRDALEKISDAPSKVKRFSKMVAELAGESERGSPQ